MKTENMPKRLTVIIRDETPLIAIGEPCSYRRVTLELTDQQRIALELKQLGPKCREEISQCFLEMS